METIHYAPEPEPGPLIKPSSWFQLPLPTTTTTTTAATVTLARAS